MSTTTKSRLSAKAGFCDDAKCVFERSDCDDPNTWLASGEITGSPYQAYEQDYSGNCLLARTMREMSLGRCMVSDEQQMCSPNAASCPTTATSSSFIPDKQCTTETTTFGACTSTKSGAARCSWSPDDCIEEEEEVWSFPVDNCTCNEVRVGGCERDGFAYCAVSPDGCGDDTTWLGPLDVTEVTGTECYLCMGIPSDTMEPAEMNGDNNGIVLPANNEQTNRHKRIIGSVPIGLFFFGAMFMVMRLTFSKYRKMQTVESASSQSVAKTEATSNELSISHGNDAEKNDDDSISSSLSSLCIEELND